MTLSPSNHEALYESIIDRFTAWAEGVPAIRAAIVIGSRARMDHPADQWSDLDIVTFADDPALLLEDASWLRLLGEPAITLVHGTPVGGFVERRVLFRNGCDLDVPILPAGLIDDLTTGEPDAVLTEVLGSVMARGYRVLLDRSGKLERSLAGMSSSSPASPTQADLDETVADFWYHCVWTAKKLRRGEMYTAHDCLDGYLRHLMMRLIRWNAEHHGGSWHGTRFMEEWLPPEVADVLPGTWALHTTEDIARAMERMMFVVSRLAQRIAADHGLTLQPDTESIARSLIRDIIDLEIHVPGDVPDNEDA